MRDLYNILTYVWSRSLAEPWEFLFGAQMGWVDGAR